ncbi:conjugal transfer protein TraA (plasmid) [Agrobacterium tumefaciens]|uniref:relaxase/mobilization nuclease domain-containing protein n=1 Tax=Agrobacterium pusense TaxID=648995 RepID=UPI000D1B9FA9|nr:conjugal transfer protein TraA [Agrobacterium pusense]QCM13801.1 conjugal transfer protein TraA [Agrobacterium tumefaciens]
MEFFFGTFTSEWEQRRAALLHEMTLGGRGRAVEEELEKRLKNLQHQVGMSKGGSASRGGVRTSAFNVSSPSRTMAAGSGAMRSMDVRLASVAKGSQPAVVKLASYGGGARVGSMLNYVSRGGELKVENENSETLRGREELARLRGDWDHLFQNRTESRDIGAFSVEVSVSGGSNPHEQVRDVLSSGFGDRRYAYSVETRTDGSLKVEGYVVLRSGQGERLTADAKAAAIVQERFDASAVAKEAPAAFSFTGYGNGVEYGAAKLRDLIAQRNDVRDDQGRSIADDKAAGDLVQKEWRDELHSRKSRDVMHVIMSARAGTDAVAFEGAVRDFLAEQFAGHRYVFAMHDPESDPKEAGEGGKRPHVHAHAIVTMRSESGDRIETTPATFRQWREVMAEKARDHGINMEMTDRREFATPPAFTRNQVRAVKHDGRTEHVGTSDPAQARYDAKRAGRRVVATSQRSRQYILKAQETWQKIAVNAGDTVVAAYAAQHRSYLENGLAQTDQSPAGAVIHADFGGDYRSNMVAIRDMLSEAKDMREQTRPEFEAYEKTVETALFNLQRSAGPEDRSGFEEVSSLAREIVDLRRQMLEMKERGLDEQDGRNAAGDVSRESGVAPERTASEVQEQTNANLQWEAAVAKHGEAVVEAGNDAMANVEHYRSGLAHIEAGELGDENREQYEKGLEASLHHAAQLAATGNGYLRDVANEDPELRAEIETIERNEERGDENKSNKQPITADTADDRQRDLRVDLEEERPIGQAEREAHQLAETVDATQRQQDRVNRDREAAQRGGETTRTDPAQQHIPRLEELEREQVEQRERNRDDRDR